MLLGLDFNISKFRSLSDKLQLLEKSIELGDGDIITTIVLFMKRTLTPEIFHRMILSQDMRTGKRKYNSAIDHYCAYLKQKGDIDTLEEVLSSLDRSDEQAFVKLEQVLHDNKKMKMTKKSMDTFVQKLENCLSERFNTVKTLKADQDILVQQIQLIKRQFDIDDGDEKLKKFKATKFNDFEHKPSLMGATVIETVYYCALFHYISTRKACHPAQVSKFLGIDINSNEYQFVLLNALVRQNDWKSVNLEFQKSQDPSDLSSAPDLSGLPGNLGNNKFMSAFTKNFSETAKIAKQKVESMMNSERSNVNISPIMATMLFRGNNALVNEFCRQIECPVHKKRLADLFDLSYLLVEIMAEDGQWQELENIISSLESDDPAHQKMIVLVNDLLKKRNR